MKKNIKYVLLAVLVVLLILQLTGIGIPNIPKSTIFGILIVVLLMEISKKLSKLTDKEKKAKEE